MPNINFIYKKLLPLSFIAIAVIIITVINLNLSNNITPTASATALLPSGELTRSPNNPIVRNGPADYDFNKAGPRVVIKNAANDYRIWYEAVGSSGLTGIAYATSTDGINWDKKGLVLQPDQEWEKEEISPNTILIENGIYKLWYHGGGYIVDQTRLGKAEIGYATSTDGINWIKHANNPILSTGSNGEFDDDQAAEPRVFNLGGSYRMYYTGKNVASKQTSLGMATSTNGIDWVKYSSNPIIPIGSETGKWGNSWGGAFFYENDMWHLWRGKSARRTKSGLIYASSTDGINWVDGPNGVVLSPNSDQQAPDYSLVGDSVSGYKDGDQYRIMYTGFNWNLFGSEGRFEGICLAYIVDPNKTLDPSPEPNPDPAEAENESFLYGRWKFNESSGSTTADDSTNNFTGTLVNNPSRIATSSGYGLDFAGNSEYVNIGDIDPPGNITLEAWVFPENPGPVSSILFGKNPSEYDFRIGGNGQLQATVGGVFIEAPGFNFYDPANSNQWYHLVYTFNKTTGLHKLYRNGKEVASGINNSYIANKRNPLWLGRNSQYNFGSFLGKLDELSIYNQELTAEQINAKYIKFTSY